MPLVVPGINSGGDDKNAQWMNKLMGKKLGDDHDQTVRLPYFFSSTLFLNPCPTRRDESGLAGLKVTAAAKRRKCLHGHWVKGF